MRNRPYGFEIYLVNVKTIRQIAQIFVAFSEKLNFNKDKSVVYTKYQTQKSHKICTHCRVSEAKIYLYHSSKIAKVRPR